MVANLLEQLPVEFQELPKAPQKIWYRGNLELLNMPKVSIVGTRRPLAYTREMTYRIASELAKRGVTVVSGAAMGVDGIAHRGAGADSTIAILGTGIDIHYPAVNASLIESIAQQGLLLSRFKPGMRASRWSFVVRNELVVALGKVLVITQADRDSGSMRSAEIAKRLGRPIWVLPHRLGESEGSNDLLREGSANVIYDILEFVERFGENLSNKESLEDEFLTFCQKNPTVDEVLSRFGTRLYEAELTGEVEIFDGRVRLL